jgi:chromate transporter
MLESGSARHAPGSCGELFLAFQRLALQGFGGVLPVAHRELVERLHWMTDREFVELLSLGQVLPGPNIINVALIFGDRHFGWRGALAACAGMLVGPLAIVLALVSLYRHFAAEPMVAGALRGMGAVAAGLILGTAYKLASTLKKNALGWPLCALFALATLVAIGFLRWPLVWVLLGLGPVAVAIAWVRLAARERRAAEGTQ